MASLLTSSIHIRLPPHNCRMTRQSIKSPWQTLCRWCPVPFGFGSIAHAHSNVPFSLMRRAKSRSCSLACGQSSGTSVRSNLRTRVLTEPPQMVTRNLSSTFLCPHMVHRYRPHAAGIRSGVGSREINQKGARGQSIGTATSVTSHPPIAVIGQEKNTAALGAEVHTLSEMQKKEGSRPSLCRRLPERVWTGVAYSSLIISSRFLFDHSSLLMFATFFVSSSVQSPVSSETTGICLNIRVILYGP